MQLPCIAPDVGGISELVSPETGRLVQDCSDIAGYVEALRELEGDARLRRKLGLQARTVVERDFSLERHQEDYIRLYSELSALPAAALKAEPGEVPSQGGLQ
jgi:glycosyltransferase involved in cell wall biosynthesis